MKNNTGCRAASSEGQTKPSKPFDFTPVPPTSLRIVTLRAIMASQNAVPKKKNSTNVILAIPKPTFAAALGSTPEAHTMKKIAPVVIRHASKRGLKT